MIKKKTNYSSAYLSTSAGVGLRAPHYAQVLAEQPKIPWFEVHSENYFSEGGYPLYYLEKIREHYPISLHGVSLSLGSQDALNLEHLKKLKQLVARIDPCFVSDHLSWSSIDNQYLHDLFPLPYTQETLAHVISRVLQVQDFLDKQLLIENISSYTTYSQSTMPEWEFLTALAKKTGCGILLDINNLYVNAKNLGTDAIKYIQQIPAEYVCEIHLAGFTPTQISADSVVLIDTHSQPITQDVWDLYQYTIDVIGAKPTLIEWDNDLPALGILLQEAEKANHTLLKSKAYAS